MSNITKLALEDALKKQLMKKPLDKITIKDLTEELGISRMSFYYHFKDIYDLVEYACVHDAKQALQENRTYDTWQEGLTSIFDAVLLNKPFHKKCLSYRSQRKCRTILICDGKRFVAEGD